MEPGSQPAAKQFVIVCAPRTGSTFLRLMLNAHPDLCCHGEVLGPVLRALNGLDTNAKSNIMSALLSQKNADPVRFLNDLVLFQGAFHAVGLKVLYYQMLAPEMAPVWAWLIENKDVYVIHLIRRDHFRRYLSQKVAEVTGVPLVKVGGAKPEAPQLEVSMNDCLAKMRSAAKLQKDFRDELARERLLELDYETLEQETDATLAQLFAFLGVENRSVSIPTEKLGETDLSKSVSNLDAVRAGLMGTEFEGLV